MTYKNYGGIDSQGRSWTTCYDYLTEAMQHAAEKARKDGRARYVTMEGKIRLNLTKAEKRNGGYYIVAADEHKFIHEWKTTETYPNPVFSADYEPTEETSIWG